MARVTTRDALSSWHAMKPWLEYEKAVLESVLADDEAAYDEHLKRMSEVPKKLEGLLDFVQVAVASNALLLHLRDKGYTRDDVQTRVLSWDNFIRPRMNEVLARRMIQHVVDPTLGPFASISDHWDYVTNYMPTIIGIGAFGLGAGPAKYSSWRDEFDVLAEEARRYRRRILVKRFFSFRPQPHT